ncbi:hypothetical protein SAMN05660816_06702 [Niastella yeongjuensis]|nr:hypothetical protein SAMN05660816_06702 [Niastella yeongjuensis]
MQRRMSFILFLLLIKNLAISQSVEQTIGSQLDKVTMLTMGNKDFIVSAYTGNQVFVVKGSIKFFV